MRNFAFWCAVAYVSAPRIWRDIRNAIKESNGSSRHPA